MGRPLLISWTFFWMACLSLLHYSFSFTFLFHLIELVNTGLSDVCLNYRIFASQLIAYLPLINGKTQARHTQDVITQNSTLIVAPLWCSEYVRNMHRIAAVQNYYISSKRNISSRKGRTCFSYSVVMFYATNFSPDWILIFFIETTKDYLTISIVKWFVFNK